MRGRIELAPGVGFALNMNALCRYEDETGETFVAGIQRLEGGDLSMKDLRLLVWVGLEDRSKTLEDAGEVIDAIGIKSIGAKLVDAVRAAFPDAAAGEPGNPTAPGK